MVKQSEKETMGDDVSQHKNVSSFGATLINGNFIFNNVIFLLLKKTVYSYIPFFTIHIRYLSRKAKNSPSLLFDFSMRNFHMNFLWRLLSSGTYFNVIMSIYFETHLVFIVLCGACKRRMQILYYFETRIECSMCTVT